MSVVIVAYASSTRPNALWSAAQFNSALPKNRTECDIPLVSKEDYDKLRDALEAIRIYGSDTLSGRVDGPDDKDWYRDGVREMRNRARAALPTPSATE
ncbi:MAG: hypothetical protein AAAB13_20740 [Pseudomonas sp.]